MYAAEYGFILHQVQLFIPAYNLSSYGGTDRSFRISRSSNDDDDKHQAYLYKFRWPSINHLMPEQYQLAVRHEIRIIISPQIFVNCLYS